MILNVSSMKKSELTFIEGFTANRGADKKTFMAFDWAKAAAIIKSKLLEYPNLSAEAGLQGDWDYTGGVIFEDGKPTNDDYTYLCSNWATPTLIISVDGDEIDEIQCYETDNKYSSDSKWDDESLSILEIQLSQDK